jgi:small subunit ribosomal protein S15
MLTVEEKQSLLSEYRLADADTGSVEVQVALLSADIKKLTEHFKEHKHDFHSRTGLTRKVNHRRKLLKYLRNRHLDRYRQLLKRLGLRDTI